MHDLSDVALRFLGASGEEGGCTHFMHGPSRGEGGYIVLAMVVVAIGLTDIVRGFYCIDYFKKRPRLTQPVARSFTRAAAEECIRCGLG